MFRVGRAGLAVIIDCDTCLIVGVVSEIPLTAVDSGDGGWDPKMGRIVMGSVIVTVNSVSHIVNLFLPQQIFPTMCSYLHLLLLHHCRCRRYAVDLYVLVFGLGLTSGSLDALELGMIESNLKGAINFISS